MTEQKNVKIKVQKNKSCTVQYIRDEQAQFSENQAHPN